MTSKTWDAVQTAARLLTQAILDTATATNSAARDEGFDVDRIDGERVDLKKTMTRLRAIRQELEDLEFVEFL